MLRKAAPVDRNDRPGGTDYRSAWAIARIRRGVSLTRKANSSTPAQILKTLLFCTFWLSISPIFIHLIAPYRDYGSAQIGIVGLIIFGGISVHLWPTRTAPWRTMGWAMFSMIPLGSIALTMGMGSYALTLTTMVGFLIILCRVNSNLRRFIAMVRTWREIA